MKTSHNSERARILRNEKWDSSAQYRDECETVIISDWSDKHSIAQYKTKILLLGKRVTFLLYNIMYFDYIAIQLPFECEYETVQQSSV